MEKHITILLKDPQVIKIVEQIPKEHFDEIIEKYILVGDTVFRYASIVPMKESLETFFQPVLTELKTKAEMLGTLGNTISEIFRLGKPAEKGKIGVESIYRDLSANFRDDEFEDVSGAANFTDIKAVPKDGVGPVLIEVKDYTTPVPTYEVEKFWRDMDYRGALYGIFVSMRTRITLITDDIKIVPKGNKTAIFLVNEKLGWQGHTLAYYVIKKLAETQRKTAVELEKDKLTQVLEKLSEDLKRIKNEMLVISEIVSTAKSLQEHSTRELTRIIEKAGNLKTRVDTIIENAFKESS